jgi:transposase InsO family protein
VKGIFFYLYMVMDIFSRKILGWQAHDNESSALASDLLVDICRQENIKRNQVVLHSDNGSPMKGATMLRLCKSWASCHHLADLLLATTTPIQNRYLERLSAEQATLRNGLLTYLMRERR